MPIMKWGAARAALAFDRASLRDYDADGRLHVELTPISKANVCPYYGREIPDYQSLGLDPEKVYRLYRDPGELARAAPSFNNLPLLSRHVPVTADSHQPDLVVGSTGTDAAFEAPYLKNSLVIWARDAIGGVESHARKELSCAYRYRADMTPGAVEGELFDGVMRDIVGNHVALVMEGRAGPDVVVGDSMENSPMAKTVLSRKAVLAQGAAMAVLAPRLAADAQVDISPAFAGVTARNYRSRKPAIIAEITRRVAGRLAADADLEDLPEVLDGLDNMNPAEEAEFSADPADGPARDPAADAEARDPIAALTARVNALAAQVAKLQANGRRKARASFAAPSGGDVDLSDEDEGPPGAPPMDDPLTGTSAMDGAMDGAIAAAVRAADAAAMARFKALRAAETAVRPYVGELAVAQDSAEGVYRTALRMLGVKVEGVHPSAYPAILQAQPVPGSARRMAPLAQDAAANGFAERYPSLALTRMI